MLARRDHLPTRLAARRVHPRRPLAPAARLPTSPPPGSRPRSAPAPPPAGRSPCWKFSATTFDRSPISKITTPHVRQWRAALLDKGIGEPTVVKADQILRAILNTAVHDGLIQRNPCRMKGAGAAKTAERPYLTVPEVYRLADKVPACFRVLVRLAAFTGLRFGELAALQRHDVDLERRTISVRRAQAETRAEGLVIKTPKSNAGIRPVALSRLPGRRVDDSPRPVRRTGPERTGLHRPARRAAAAKQLPPGMASRATRRWPVGRSLPRSPTHRQHPRRDRWRRATRELMHRMGHSSVRAALSYQHLVCGRDHAIADHVDEQIRQAKRGRGKPSGT